MSITLHEKKSAQQKKCRKKSKSPLARRCSLTPQIETHYTAIYLLPNVDILHFSHIFFRHTDSQ